jgi:hypothetical protein
VKPVYRRSLLSRKVPARVLICMVVLVAASMALATTATAAATESAQEAASSDLCVGLECDVPASGSYVSEAQGDVPTVAGLDELTAQKDSGFYELPALVYRGDVQPHAVVYLSKPSEFDRMPMSVRSLDAVQDYAPSAGSSADTLVVIDHGISMVIPAERAVVAARPRARAAGLEDCDPRHFCIYDGEDFLGLYFEADGPNYTGTGWHNFGTNVGGSMANYRDGDSLLADHSLGEGTRYCAQQQSVDADFDNNAIGSHNASSWALLTGSDDRC